MFNSHQNRNEDRKDEKPPYSRIFVVCSKQSNEEELTESFGKYGHIEDLYIPKDRNTGESKGIAYIKYAKTSSAAAAIQELHLKSLKPNTKPIKVLIATNKNDTSSTNEEKYKRLFIRVPRDEQEKEIDEHFSKFGEVDSVHLQKDRNTGLCKGFAYVHFTNFLDAAKAFEECDKSYKPVFATPRDELKRSRNSLDLSGFHSEGPHKDIRTEPNHNTRDNTRDTFSDNFIYQRDSQKVDCFSLGPNSITPGYDTIIVTCSPQVPQKHIERLFSIVPGMTQCQYTLDTYNGYCKCVITYDSKKSAVYAYEKINNFEFPSGEIITIKPDDNPLNKVANNLADIVNNFKNSLDAGNPNLLQLADAIAQTSSLIKAATSGNKDQKGPYTDESYGICLPPCQPMASINSRVAQRCFIVCKPQPPPLPALRELFCRFGDLIDVCTFPNKNFGFVKYASTRAASEAMSVLHDVVIRGVHFKVLEADERPSKEDDHRMNLDNSSETHSENGKDRKRIKLLHHNDRELS